MSSLSHHQIALVGFTAAEYGTFETFFRLVSSRRPQPFKASREIDEASLVLVETSDTDDIERVFAKYGERKRIITVGARRVAEAWRHLDRPINLNAVLAAVDAALVDHVPAQSSSVPTSANAAVTATAGPGAIAAPQRAAELPTISPNVARAPTLAATVARDTASVTAVPPAVSAVARNSTPATIAPRSIPAAPISSRSSATSFKNAESERSNVTRLQTAAPRVEATIIPTSPVAVVAPPAVGAARVNILVVDDSDVALKFIHSRLSAFGFTVHKCSSGEEALVRVADGDYQFVFLDVMMAGLDGYQTCKAIKGRRYASGKAPAVVMLTSRGGTIDKVRGTFAGCDAYLTKPLDETKMLKVLLKHDSEIANALSTLATAPSAPPPPPRTPARAPNPLAAAYEGLSNGSE